MIFIRYAEFNVPYEALETAMQADIDSYGSEHHINWIEPLAYLGAKYGGNFSSYKKKRLSLYSGKATKTDETWMTWLRI